MKVENIDVTNTIAKAKESIKKDKNMLPATKAVVELLIMLITILVNRLGLNSSNSSKPPSTDTTNKNKKKKTKSNKPRGGQNGHKGTTLKPVDKPDEIKDLKIDRRTLPKGKKYKPNGYVSRQLVNIQISRIITEYRAEILIDEEGNQYTADFPDGLKRPIQYGTSTKAHSTYMSTYQLIPYERIQEQFKNEYKIPVSTGSICNFNAEASELLVLLKFDEIAKQVLKNSYLNHADETSINIDGKRIWLHNISNNNWTWFEPHKNRGSEAMEYIGIIPFFNGILCHDHWKPYYKYKKCDHSLCNAHHLRELTRSFEQDGQKWAEKMRLFLVQLNKEVSETDEGVLTKNKATRRKIQYRKILDLGDRECPDPKQVKKSKKRIKRSKSRNLLIRLREFENDVLRFISDPLVPFTNNLGERDIRMSKVQQKISGCFRSMDGAINFCRIRSYLSTCKKNDVSATEALNMLFNKKLPNFIQEKLDSS